MIAVLLGAVLKVVLLLTRNSITVSDWIAQAIKQILECLWSPVPILEVGFLNMNFQEPCTFCTESHGLLILKFSISCFYSLFVHIIHIAKCHDWCRIKSIFLLLTRNNITVSVWIAQSVTHMPRVSMVPGSNLGRCTSEMM